MTKEEIRLQVALSCIQGVLEAKHGIIGEIIPEIAVKESLRIADEFVKQWDKKETSNTPTWKKCKKGDIPDDNTWYISMDKDGKLSFARGEVTENGYYLTVQDLKNLPIKTDDERIWAKKKYDGEINTKID